MTAANRLSLAFLRQRFVLMRHKGFAAGDGKFPGTSVLLRCLEF
jgi:hypothetical protein